MVKKKKKSTTGWYDEAKSEAPVTTLMLIIFQLQHVPKRFTQRQTKAA